MNKYERILFNNDIEAMRFCIDEYFDTAGHGRPCQCGVAKTDAQSILSLFADCFAENQEFVEEISD